MSITNTSNGLSISGTIFINELEDFILALKEQINLEKEVINVDMSSVEAIDTSAIQVMISAKKTAEKFKKKLLFLGFNNTLKESISILGLDNFFPQDKKN